MRLSENCFLEGQPNGPISGTGTEKVVKQTEVFIVKKEQRKCIVQTKSIVSRRALHLKIQLQLKPIVQRDLNEFESQNLFWPNNEF